MHANWDHLASQQSIAPQQLPSDDGTTVQLQPSPARLSYDSRSGRAHRAHRACRAPAMSSGPSVLFCTLKRGSAPKEVNLTNRAPLFLWNAKANGPMSDLRAKRAQSCLRVPGGMS